MDIKTLEVFSKRFILDDPRMTNYEVAKKLKLVCGEGEHLNKPDMLFYNEHDFLVCIRVSKREIALLVTFESNIILAEQIATRIIVRNAEEESISNS